MINFVSKIITICFIQLKGAKPSSFVYYQKYVIAIQIFLELFTDLALRPIQPMSCNVFIFFYLWMDVVPLVWTQNRMD